jgi:hypothetical protein
MSLQGSWRYGEGGGRPRCPRLENSVSKGCRMAEISGSAKREPNMARRAPARHARRTPFKQA